MCLQKEQSVFRFEGLQRDGVKRALGLLKMMVFFIVFGYDNGWKRKDVTVSGEDERFKD